MFSVVSLLLAYSNRFLAIETRIRKLRLKAGAAPDSVLLRLRSNLLHQRVRLIRCMQAPGGCLLSCVTAVLFGVTGEIDIARWSFVTGLILSLGSVATVLRKISISPDALDLELGGVTY